MRRGRVPAWLRAGIGIAAACAAIGAGAAIPPGASAQPISEYWFLFESRLPSAVTVRTTSGADCWNLFERNFSLPGRLDDDPGTTLQRVAACGPAAEQRRTLRFAAPRAGGADIPDLEATLALRPGDPPRMEVPLRPDGTPLWSPLPLAAGGGIVCASFDQGIERRGSLDLSRVSLSRDPRCSSAGPQPGEPPRPARGTDENAGRGSARQASERPTDFLEVLGDACRLLGHDGCEAAEAARASELSAYTGRGALVGVNDLTIRAATEGVYTDVGVRRLGSRSRGALRLRHRSRESVGGMTVSTTLRGQRVGEPPAGAPEPREPEAPERGDPGGGGATPIDTDPPPSQGADQAGAAAAHGVAWRTRERRWTDGATRSLTYDLDFSRSDGVRRDERTRTGLAADVRAGGQAGNYAVLAVRHDEVTRPAYDAALELGRDGISGHPLRLDEPQLATPLARLTGLSAAGPQSCVGYLAASARGSSSTARVDYSVEDIAWRVQQSGAPPVRGVTPRFLSAASGYSGTRTQCRGFARAFPSAWEYAASGVAVGRLSRRSAVCVYARPGVPPARVSRPGGAARGSRGHAPARRSGSTPPVSAARASGGRRAATTSPGRAASARSPGAAGTTSSSGDPGRSGSSAAAATITSRAVAATT